VEEWQRGMIAMKPSSIFELSTSQPAIWNKMPAKFKI
jgi:hypothetical protein